MGESRGAFFLREAVTPMMSQPKDAAANVVMRSYM